MLTTSTLLDRIYATHDAGQTDAALDLIYDTIDELLTAGKFEAVDRILWNLRTRPPKTDILLGFLTVTLPARSRLAWRAPIVEVSRCHLGATCEAEEAGRLLKGLE